jgi:copper chaperone CopZ
MKMISMTPSSEKIKRANLKLLDLTSSSDAQAIKNKLLKIEGVQKVSVNFVEAKARVEYNPNTIVIETLIEAVEEIGFGALDLAKSRISIQEYSFRVIGICGKCFETFVEILRRKSGIIDIKVDFDRKKVQMKFNNQKISIRDIKNSFFDFELQ